jgi:hypothetical protein
MQRYTDYLYLETALHVWYLHPSSGAHTTVSTVSVICHTVTAICRYRGRVGTGLSVLWVAYATQSTLKPLISLPEVAVFFLIIFYCCYLHLYSYTYFSVPLVPYCQHLVQLVKEIIL